MLWFFIISGLMTWTSKFVLRFCSGTLQGGVSNIVTVDCSSDPRPLFDKRFLLLTDDFILLRTICVTVVCFLTSF